ncbi:unnamed protein product [Prorocentrum cordatum]|uniref:Uncharacterized protein n=1 Tax=Prorocentrum cordatum TaxID=2364126 RepID=A0ABN9TFS8_9DINO|nr:unnamed protein product [Polarella glacialis]
MLKAQALLELEIKNIGAKKFMASRDFEQELMTMFQAQGWQDAEGGDGAPVAALDGDDAVLWDLLDEARKTGFKFKKRTALGSRFERWMKKHWTEQQVLAYDNGSNSYKEKERQDWALARFQYLEKTRKLIEERVESDQIIGTPMNLDALIQAEGGFDRPSAVQGALNIARNMIRKGPPYVSINPDSGRLEFTRRTKRSILDTRKSYQNITEEHNGKKQRTGAASSGLPRDRDDPATHAEATPQTQGLRTATETPLKTEKSTGNTGNDKPSTPRVGKPAGKEKKDKTSTKDKKEKESGKGKKTPKSDKVPEGKAFTKAIQDVLNTYSTTTQSARSIIDKATSDEEWASIRSFLPRVQTRLSKVMDIYNAEDPFSNMILNGIDDESYPADERYKSSMKILAELGKLQDALVWLRQMKDLSNRGDSSE